jgi:25S rRNA (cytosine2278-C5)-methyltransferase
MNNCGQIFAFDRDQVRLKRLQDNVNRLKCKNISAVCQDFLTIDVHDPKYQNVRGLIVDPSCSGSGIVSRGDQFLPQSQKDENDQKERLHNLSEFQVKILQKALSFPSAQFVVYSTCSIHEIENEEVVLQILNSQVSLYHFIYF